MGNYATLLVLLSMATTARCSWISGGAPPPASIGDIVTIGDDFTETPSSSPDGSDFMAEEKDGIASGPSGDFMIQGKNVFTTGRNDFLIQGKDLVADGPAASGGDLVIQGKESVPADGDKFIVHGKIYCDPCRIQFPTKISYPLPNTKIILVCHKEETKEETYRLEGTSDDKGRYTLNAVGDHAEEVCEITVAESPDPKCPELMDDENHVRVSLTNKHGGVKGNARFANPLGFMVTDADPGCKEVLDELGFTGI